MIKPTNAVEFWPILLSEENSIHFSEIIRNQLLEDLEPQSNPKFNAVL